MMHVFMPQNDTSKRIFYDHQTKIPPPIGRVHLDGSRFVLGNLVNVTHTFQIAAYRFFVDIILDGKLFQRLFALYIVGYDLTFVAT